MSDEPEAHAPEEGPGPVEETLTLARAALQAGQDAVSRPVEGTISVAKAALGRAGRALGGDEAARQRRLRRQAKMALPLLYQVHPEARRALPHPLGIRTIPLSEVVGSEVEPAQRGGDFLPLRERRNANWRGRWQRLRQANDRLAHFPPIDVYHYADGYWVMDGHNRVALALYEGQGEIDANVTDLHLPGEPIQRSGALMPLLEEARDGGMGTFGPQAPSTATEHGAPSSGSDGEDREA